MTTTQPLTLVEHAALGDELHALRQRAASLRQRIDDHYPRKQSWGGKAAAGLRQIDKALNLCRNFMDSQAFDDHPILARDSLYYRRDQDNTKTRKQGMQST